MGLSAVAARVEGKDAAQAVANLAQVMKDSKDTQVLRELAQALSAMASRVEARDAARAAATLVQAIKDTNDGLALQQLIQALSVVATRLEPQDAAGSAATLVKAMQKTNLVALWPLAKGLSAVAPPWKPRMRRRPRPTSSKS